MSDAGLTQWLSNLAARTPAPGGGALACALAAQATALFAMVARYSKGPRFGHALIERLDRDQASLMPLATEDQTAFAALNRARSPAAWERSIRLSRPLAVLGARAAEVQLMSSRHFIAEHPQGSEMWRMPAWTALAERWPIAWVVIDQCAVGLRGPRTGSFIRKPTELWASDEALLSRLRGCRCPGNHVHADPRRTSPDGLAKRRKMPPDGPSDSANFSQLGAKK